MKPKLELVPQKVGSSLHTFYYNEKCFESPWHFHTEMELTYITQSSGIRYVGSSIENFQPGDMVLIGPSLPHAWKNNPNYSNGASSICVQWKHELITDHIFAIVEFQEVKQLLQKAGYGIHFKPSSKINLIGNRLMGLPAYQRPYRVIEFLSILYELANVTDIELLSGPGTKLINISEQDTRVQDILNYLDTNYNKRITIQDMADLTFMTKSSFCKYFKNLFTKTFTQYLNEFRIKYVCQELTDSDKSVTSIALDCGYENMSYFHRQFKGIKRTTPSEYRKQSIKNHISG